MEIELARNLAHSQFPTNPIASFYLAKIITCRHVRPTIGRKTGSRTDDSNPPAYREAPIPSVNVTISLIG